MPGISKLFSNNKNTNEIDTKAANVDMKNKLIFDNYNQGFDQLGMKLNANNTQSFNNYSALNDTFKNDITNQIGDRLSEMTMKLDSYMTKIDNIATTPVVQPSENISGLVESLNNRLDLLISTNERIANLNDDQLRVQKGFVTNDVFSMGT